MVFWILISIAVVLFLRAAFAWSRQLMARAEGPRYIRSQAELDAVFGQPGMSELGAQIEEHRDDLVAVECFACGHLPVFHLDPRSPCECCTQSELIDIDLDVE